jgi:hypothetical protein
MIRKLAGRKIAGSEFLITANEKMKNDAKKEAG